MLKRGPGREWPAVSQSEMHLHLQGCKLKYHNGARAMASLHINHNASETSEEEKQNKKMHSSNALHNCKVMAQRPVQAGASGGKDGGERKEATKNEGSRERFMDARSRTGDQSEEGPVVTR